MVVGPGATAFIVDLPELGGRAKLEALRQRRTPIDPWVTSTPGGFDPKKVLDESGDLKTKRRGILFRTAVLSWITILRKREGYRRAFAGFDPSEVARFDDARVEALLGDPGIVRNRLKVRSAVTTTSVLPFRSAKSIAAPTASSKSASSSISCLPRSMAAIREYLRRTVFTSGKRSKPIIRPNSRGQCGRCTR